MIRPISLYGTPGPQILMDLSNVSFVHSTNALPFSSTLPTKNVDEVSP